MDDKILITYSKCLYLIYKDFFDKDNFECIQRFKINSPDITEKEKKLIGNILQIIHTQSPFNMKKKSEQFSGITHKSKEHIETSFNEFSKHIEDNERDELLSIMRKSLIRLLKNNVYNPKLLEYIERDNYIQEDFLHSYDIVCYAALYKKQS